MSLEVLDPGPLTTVQDRGRVGWAHVGVPRAGALDTRAADLANRLVGNPAGAAVLETTLGGTAFRALRALTLAVTGAECTVSVAGRAVSFAAPVTVRAGATVTVGPARAGVRSYVAVAGGIDVEPVLGSRSTDTLAWVGPPRLRAGQVLPVGDPVGRPGSVDHVARRRPEPVLRLRRGPRAGWMTTTAWEHLDGSTWRVAADSDRIGLRLDGRPLPRARDEEVPSEGIVLGAVQLPPSGHPVVFLADHPVTGGYPVVAVLEPEDLGVCAQARPGEEVRVLVVG